MKNSHPSITIYCQSLHGAGHYVYGSILGDALASIGRVTVINAGRSSAGIGNPSVAAVLELPGIYRDHHTRELRSEQPGLSWEELRERRRAIFEKHIDQEHPAALIVDYFPFQRWESGEEILGMIRKARSTNGGAKIICSVRDFPKPAADAAERRRVAETLNEYFDCVLVHGDPVTCLQSEAFQVLSEVKIPVMGTGYLARNGAPVSNNRQFHRDVVVSCGGGADSGKMLLVCIEAWRRIVERREDGGRRMTIFLGAYLAPGDAAVVKATAAQVPSVRIMPFGAEYFSALREAGLSISCAGDNTCSDIMTAGVRAIFIPSEAVSDQCARAQWMQQLGVGRAILPGELGAETLARAIVEGFHATPAAAAVPLDGAEFTARYVKQMLENGAQ